ncbi:MULTISPECIES: helicase associated domain-containing protein [Glutamicibacter]|uniref:helicase associated domain-containing protein n=1 Tax=Glutamicibacter TaxID=1742989 RepID=UPI00195A142E|nr:helicase associated domain-containing protein [Glutamicibacter protophormiae]QRQ80562.1 helicase associated domain-containing protein [Glutamicibacter protophormiae]
MVSWNVSRHPEWDQLYLAGSTAREIAEACHRNVATVHYHLQRREHYEPGFRSKHAAALAARRENDPPASWRRRAKEVAAFQAEHGRLPRTTGTRLELSLHHWLAEQRKLFEAGELPSSKIVLLQGIEGWNHDPRQQEVDELWRTRLASLSQYVAEHQCLPRYRNHASDTERSLGVWLHNQHQGRTKGTLPEWRREALDLAVPGWRSRG